MSRKRQGGRLSPFVPLNREMIKTPAWQALSHGARLLFVALKWHYNKRIGNAVYKSIREAAKELGSNKDSIGRWYRELEHYGFIRQISGGCLGVDGVGKAAHWRLTDDHYNGQPPTRDYLKWNGERYHEQKPLSYYMRKKQNPVPKSGDRVSPKVGTVAAKISPPKPQSVPKSGDITTAPTVPKSGDITSLPLGSPDQGPLLSDDKDDRLSAAKRTLQAASIPINRLTDADIIEGAALAMADKRQPTIMAKWKAFIERACG
jgi:hypothetical protein